MVQDFTLQTIEKNYFVCNNCNYHYRVTSDEYIKLLIDNNNYEEYEKEVTSVDPLDLKLPKSYSEQIEKYKQKTDRNSAVTILKGKSSNVDIILAVMDFTFIGGSMGSVVGHKIGYAIDKADENNLP